MFYFPPLFPLKGARGHAHSSQGNPQPLPLSDGPDNYRIFIRLNIRHLLKMGHKSSITFCKSQTLNVTFPFVALM